MRVTVLHPVYGQIDYEENFWTGKKRIIVNGQELEKQDKTTYALYGSGDPVVFRLTGNFMRGVILDINGETVRMTPAAKWYEIVCSVSIFVLILIWGNSVTLCSVFPVVGGAIGGAISGATGFTNLLLMKSQKNVGVKLAIFAGMLVGTVAICSAIASVILAAFA